MSRFKDLVIKSNRMNLPEMAKLTEQLVKNIINCSEGIELRKKLIRFYESEYVDFKLVVNIIEDIN